MKQVQFIQVALFASILLAAVLLPLAIAEIFKYLAFLPRIEVDEPLLLVLPREVGEARFQRLSAIRAEFFANDFQVNLDPSQARPKRLLQATPCIRRFLFERGSFLPDLHNDGHNTQKAKTFQPLVTLSELQYGLK